MIPMTSSEPCPCGQDRPYQTCCGPLHRGETQAETAVALMRSRYAAFSKGLVDYLLATHHPSTRNSSNRLSLQKTVQTTQWLKLELLDQSGGTAEDQTGFVEFIAYFQAEKPGALRERSRFLKEAGVWYYVDGEQKKADSPGRNDPCWCGSGKKTKKCHGVID